MFHFSFLNTMTLIAYHKGCLLADRLHSNTDIAWAPQRFQQRKILITKCKRAAMAITGPSFNERYRHVLADALVDGIAAYGGDLAEYLHFLYNGDKKAVEDRKVIFQDYGNFSMILATSTGAFSISRHDEDTDSEVMPRRYDFENTASFGTGATAFQMLAALNYPLFAMTKLIAANDYHVSVNYDIVRSAELVPFKPVIRADKED